MELGRADAAEYFVRALVSDPLDYASLDRLAMLRFNEERYDESLTLYNIMVELAPTSHAVHTNLGITLHRLGQADDARAHLEQALSIAPEYELALAMLAQIEDELAEPPVDGQD